MVIINLKENRERLGLSLEELGVKANVSPRTIWNAERGKSCTANTAKRLAKSLGVKLEDLREVTP